MRSVLRRHHRTAVQSPTSDLYPMDGLRDDWRFDARCRDQDTDVWLYNHRPSPPLELQEECAKCPVQIPCLIEALNECRDSHVSGGTVGTRAGTGPVGRNRLYRAWKRGDMRWFRAELDKAGWSGPRIREMIAGIAPSPNKNQRR